MRNFLISNETKQSVFLIIVLTIFSLVGTSVTNTTHAQELPSSDPDNNGADNDTELSKSNVHLWAPSKMIKGETYEGLWYFLMLPLLEIWS